MALQFEAQPIHCMNRVKGQSQSQEQTQELRLNDSMPDIDRVLGSWGQLIIRGKQWQSDGVGVSCGVTVYVLYATQDGAAQCVQSWLPMQLHWDLPEQWADGQIFCQGCVKSVDARAVSGRKLMLRATVSMLMQAYAPWEATGYLPAQSGEQVHVLQQVYPCTLVREVGEKAYMLDEELTLPETAPAPVQLVRLTLCPQVEEQKVLGDKLVFRGNVGIRGLYISQAGTVEAWQQELPFSQYAQLFREYPEGVQAQLCSLVTALECELTPEGKLRLKAGLSGQYVLCERSLIPVVADVYSPEKACSVESGSLELPVVLDRQTQRLRADAPAGFDAAKVVDVVFTPGCPQVEKDAQEAQITVTGQFQALYYDASGVLCAGTAAWQDGLRMSLSQQCQLDVFWDSKGQPQYTPGQEQGALRADVCLETVAVAMEQIPMITAVQLGQPLEKDPARPSLVLRRAGSHTLWQLARENGSTVEAIRAANALQAEPEPDRMLIIPVL